MRLLVGCVSVVTVAVGRGNGHVILESSASSSFCLYSVVVTHCKIICFLGANVSTYRKEYCCNLTKNC